MVRTMKTKFINLCRKLRLHSDHHSHQMACVIAKGNRLVSTGFNQLKTHSRSNHPFKSLHAEISALIKADPEELVGSQAYIYRETKNGNPAMAKPCPTCEIALTSAGVSVIFYSTENGFKEERL